MKKVPVKKTTRWQYRCACPDDFGLLIHSVKRCRAALILLLTAATSVMGPWAQAQGPGADSKTDAKKQDLARRLVRKAGDESDEDIMAELMRMMAESTKKLSITFDAGPSTQALQRKIAQRLDDAIKLAAARTRRSRSSRPQRSDKRRRSDRPAGSGESAKGPGDASQRPEGVETRGSRGGVSQKSEPPPNVFFDARRSWGDLPQREREEIIQGANERYLRRYKDWIERYYRALQEAKR